MEIPIRIPPCPLIKTGQTTEYQSGDDGTYQKGYNLSPRFVTLTTGVVLDTLTGLEWVADPSALGGDWGTLGSPSKFTWVNGIVACEALDYGGCTDWRMPNVRELFSLFILGGASSAAILNASGFSNIQINYYFSSSTPPATTYAWRVFYAASFSVTIVLKTDTWYVLPVRGG